MENHILKHIDIKERLIIESIDTMKILKFNNQNSYCLPNIFNILKNNNSQKTIFKKIRGKYKDQFNSIPDIESPAIELGKYQILKPLSIKHIFNAFGKSLEKLSISKLQLFEFCRKYPDELFSAQRDVGSTTLFLIKAKKQYLVACVFWYSSGAILNVIDINWNGSYFAFCSFTERGFIFNPNIVVPL